MSRVDDKETSYSSGTNAHIRAYLNYYIKFPSAPHYAVLIDGPWGIGKTYQVRKVLDELFAEDKSKYVYVSLFGLTSLTEIDQALFAAVYPKLNTKAARVVGKVLKSALSHFASDPDVQISDLLDKGKAELYVFDDLERCELGPNIVLGYINEFVEHDGCKVVVIANQLEIGELDTYRRQREKLIGKTLEVQSSLDEAMLHFVRGFVDDESRLFFEVTAHEIRQIYEQAGVHNLRILQQTMWDFERFLKALEPTHRSHKVAMTHSLRLFFALSFELKVGRLNISDLTHRRMYAAMLVGNKEMHVGMAEAQKRYPDTDLYDLIFSNEILINILIRGVVDPNEITQALNHSVYFSDPEVEPAWRTLWQALELTDETATKAFLEIEQQFCRRDFLLIGEILHVFGLRLWAEKVGLLLATRAEVVAQGKSYVDDLYYGGRLTPLESDDSHFRKSGYGGLQIFEHETPEYLELFKYLEDMQRKARADQYPQLARILLDEMKIDAELYRRRLCMTNSPDNIYARTPILSEISPKEFVTEFLKLQPSAQRTVLHTFKCRYESGELKRDLWQETSWLAEVRTELLRAADDQKILTKFRIRQFIVWNIDPNLYRVLEL